MQSLPQIPSLHPFFNEALAMISKVGGKYFRAQLLLNVVYFYKKGRLKEALDAALALEFIHTYSFIHDDLPAMDSADSRRSILALYKSYDETTAVLVGDALNTEAFLLSSRLNLSVTVSLKLVETLAFNAGLNGMIIGQVIDCYFEDQKLNLKELEFLHTHKTAKLIAVSLKMGCQICELDETITKQLYELGLKLDLVFQINDGITDATSSEKESRKPTDADTHKNSLVDLLGLKEAEECKDKLLEECQLEGLNANFIVNLKDLIKEYL